MSNTKGGKNREEKEDKRRQKESEEVEILDNVDGKIDLCVLFIFPLSQITRQLILL